MKTKILAAVLLVTLYAGISSADSAWTPGKPMISEHKNSLVVQVKSLWNNFFALF